MSPCSERGIMTPLVKYSQCGHVGRVNNNPFAKAYAFIRFAEIRNLPVLVRVSRCPNCRKTGE